MEKIELATIVGTIQSSMVNFKNVNEAFKENCEDERLLGVSISGIMDCPILAKGDKKILDALKQAAISTNEVWAEKLGIKSSVSVTCVKPDGNTSVLYNSAPGVHGRFSPFYIRRMRVQNNTPIAAFAIAQGIPAEPAFGETWENCKTLVLSFPVKSPEAAIIQNGRGAIEQLNSWLNFKRHYTETNPSVTINYKAEELGDISAWLYKHQDYAIGLSFLPVDEHTYQQAPYEEIDEARYVEFSRVFENINMKAFWEFEVTNDTTEAAKNLACVGGAWLI